MLLRDSPHKANASFAGVISRARQFRGEDAGGLSSGVRPSRRPGCWPAADEKSGDVVALDVGRVPLDPA